MLEIGEGHSYQIIMEVSLYVTTRLAGNWDNRRVTLFRE
jgi:hypothetical protein